MRKILTIPLSNLKLDFENVRFGQDTATNQREAMSLLMSSERESKKIYKLAEHISMHGMDPTELQLVYKDEDGRYIVLEGNRRLTALKLLLNPDNCPISKMTRDFRRLHEEVDLDTISEIACGMVSSREEGSMWLELKHTGENGGVGRVDWSGDVKDEYRARQGSGESIGRQIRKLIIENNGFCEDVKIAVAEIPVTSLSRLFSSKPAQDLFCIRISNKKLTPEFSLEFHIPSLEYAILLFKNDGMNVDDIYNDEKRKEFTSRIPLEIHPKYLIEEKDTLSKDPNKNRNNDNDSEKDQGKERGEDHSQSKDDNKDDEKKKRPRAKPSSIDRKYMINFSLSISNPRINEIYKELKQKLEVDKVPNAVSVTYRVFLELSCNEFIDRSSKSSNPVKRDDNQKIINLNESNLALKILSISTHLELSGVWTKSQSKSINKRAKAKDSLGSVDHFNEFIHTTSSSAIPNELKLIGDDYRPFLESIWNY